MSLCSSATAPAMAINEANHDKEEANIHKEEANIHEEEASDSTKHQPLTESSIKLNEVVVTGLTGSQKLKQSPAPISFVSARQLEMQPSTNIIDAIAHQPGVSQITTGSGISKPVIRGLGYNRVVVVNDGIRQEGQQWGDEHGIEIDPASVHSVEILKGPASLMYGSDAMAGVLIFHSAPTLAKGDMRANFSTGYQTNNGLFDYSLNFAGNQGGFVWNTRYSGKMAHAYKNKYDGYVFGSSLREQAFSQLLGWNYRMGHSHLTLDYYHLTPGIVEGERDEKTGELEVPDGYDVKSYGKPMPYQQIHHYKAVLDNSWFLGDGNLKLLLGYQQNRRQEFEEEENPKECGLDFMLHTMNYDLHYLSQEMNGWKFSTGINGMWQQSINKGSEFLIPAYHLFDYGVFATVSKEIGKLNLSGGIRYDHRHLHSEALREEESSENNGGLAGPDSDHDAFRFQAFKRSFEGVTGSIGLAYEILPDFNIKLNVARGFRAPNISELASNGVHEGTQRYELGNTSLKPENSWQFDLGLDYSSPIISASLSLFANRINHYIYSEKLADENNQPVLIDDTPAYQFTSGDARILGGEASIDIHPVERLHFGNTFSYVNSVQLHQPAESKYLPFTPAPRWVSDVRYEFVCDGKTFDRAYQNHLSRLKYLDVNQVTGRRGVYNMGRNFSIKVVVPIEL